MTIKTKPQVGDFCMALIRAGRFQMARDKWLADARHNRDEREFNVAYARSAHRAYLSSLKLARMLSGKPEHTWT